jgi:hypothetical protein
VIVVLRPLFAAALVVNLRYFIFAPRPFPAAPPKAVAAEAAVISAEAITVAD